MNRMKGWLWVLLPLWLPPQSGVLHGGPQFSYGVDYCLWLQGLRHDFDNPYDELGGEA